MRIVREGAASIPSLRFFPAKILSPFFACRSHILTTTIRSGGPYPLHPPNQAQLACVVSPLARLAFSSTISPAPLAKGATSAEGAAAMAKPGILVTTPLLPDLLTALDERFTVFRLWEAPDQPSFLSQHAPHIRGLVGNSVAGASTELIDALPNLEIVSSFSVGLDKVDLVKCRERGIAVTNTPDVLTDDVADLALLLLLAVFRRLCPSDRYVREGCWPVEGDVILAKKASGKRVGIVGLGRIGLAIARRAEAFGCSISYQGRSKKSEVPYAFHENIVDLAANCDALIVACPLTKETWHIIDWEVLNALGPQGTLINIARGPIVNEVELVKALVEGHLGAAGLDVFENEPDVPPELLKMDNVVLTPHVGSATWDTRRAMANLVVGNLDAHFSMKPLLTPVS